jgi:PAS domain S-box-containing protein
MDTVFHGRFTKSMTARKANNRMSRILVVDDDPTVRLLMQASLPVLGFEVAGLVEDGSQAFELAKILKPDLVLMDIILPGEMDGIEAAKKIRAELTIPVIFLTGYTDEAFINRAKCADPFGYLIKPCTEDELRVAIELALHRKSQEREFHSMFSSYRAVTESVPHTFWLCTGDYSRMLYVSPSYEKMWGRSREALLTDPLDIVAGVHPDERQYVLKEMARRKAGEMTEALFRIVRPDGCIRWLKDCAFPVKDDHGVVSRITGITEDITDRKIAEEALRENESKLRTILQAAPTGIGTVVNRFIREANDRLCHMTGYSREELLHQNARLLYPTDEEYQRVGKDKYTEISQKGIGTVETRWRRKDGAIINVFLSSVPLDPHDLSKGVTFTALDITEGKRGEAALKQAKERLELALFGSDLATYDWNLVTGEVYLDDLYLAQLGYEPGELSLNYDGWMSMIHPEDVARVRNIVEELSRNASHLANGLEYRLRHKQGHWVWILDRGRFVETDKERKPLRFTGTHLDITATKHMEEALRASEKRFRKLFEMLPVGALLYDAESLHFVLFNDSATRYLGYTREEFAKLRLPDIEASQGEESIRVKVARMVRGEKIEFATRHRTKKGDLRHVRVQELALEVSGQELVLAILTDITERERAEEELRIVEAQMRQARKMEAIGTLAGGIAHDFNNILSAIIGYTELSIMKVPEQSPAQSKLQQVLKATERAKDLVHQILTFSRQSEQEFRPVHIVPLLKEVLKFLRSSIPTTITIRKRIRIPSESAVMADPTQIHQVIMNLCTNAAYAMRGHGGTMEVGLSEIVLSEEDDRIMGPGLGPGTYLRLSVTDTGCGMDEETMQRIFDPFFTTKPREEGTGMGLAVVYGIIEACGGAITVESKLGEGSSFHVHFPKVVSPVQELHLHADDLPGGEGRILFVDDEVTLMKLGKKMLQALGYTVVAKASSLEALKVFRSQPDQFDLLITDYTMPQLTGIDLIKEVRSIRADLPIILCTGYIEFPPGTNISDLGMQAVIPKPIHQRVIAQTVSRVLQQQARGSDSCRGDSPGSAAKS